MILFSFTEKSLKTFNSLEMNLKKRVTQKLEQLKSHTHIFSLLEVVVDFEPATHRLRIGNYRLLIMQKSEDNFLILKIGHRREIYR